MLERVPRGERGAAQFLPARDPAGGGAKTASPVLSDLLFRCLTIAGFYGTKSNAASKNTALEVASMLQSYTSCSIQYAPVHGSFSHLMKAEKEHRRLGVR